MSLLPVVGLGRKPSRVPAISMTLYVDCLESRLVPTNFGLSDVELHADTVVHAADLDVVAGSMGPSTASTSISYSAAHRLVELDQAFRDFSYRGNGYSIAVLDTGIDYNHPNLGGGWGNRVIGGYDFVDNDFDPMDLNGHGTHVAGIIASDHPSNIGIAPDVNLIALRVLGADGTGDFADVANALRWVAAYQKQYNIVAVNLSLGAGNFTVDPYSYLDAPLADLDRLGVVVVASAGNDFYQYGGRPGLGYPAVANQVVSVGAVWDSTFGTVSWGGGAVDYAAAADRVVSFSQRSAYLDVLAPGAMIRSTYPNNRFSTRSGTSMAAPMVAGAAVLVREAFDRTGQSAAASPSAILGVLRGTGNVVNDGDNEQDNVPNTGLNFSRISVHDALVAVAGIPEDDPSALPTGGPAVTAALFATGTDVNAAPVVRVFSRNAVGGVTEVTAFAAYAEGFRGGVAVAMGDIDGDGVQEIVTGAGPGGGPHVRVWQRSGNTWTERGGFMAYDPGFRGGVTVAVGDIDGDGRDDIITGAGAGGGPHVRVWRVSRLGAVRELGGFMAFENTFAGGVSVAAGDINGDGRLEMIVGQGAGGKQRVAVYRLEPSGDYARIAQITSGSQSDAVGLTVAAGDLDGDRRAEIITGTGPGRVGVVRVFSTQTWSQIQTYQPYPSSSLGGVRVGVSDFDGDAIGDVLTAPGAGNGPRMRAYRGTSASQITSALVYDAAYRAGVFIAGAGLKAPQIAFTTDGGAGAEVNENGLQGRAISAAQAAGMDMNRDRDAATMWLPGNQAAPQLAAALDRVFSETKMSLWTELTPFPDPNSLLRRTLPNQSGKISGHTLQETLDANESFS